MIEVRRADRQYNPKIKLEVDYVFGALSSRS
jgi:hypothetical protein